MKKTLIILTVFMGAMTFAAGAQTASDRASIDNTFGFGPRAGFYKATDADEGNLFGGLNARARLGSLIGIEGTIEYRAGQTYGIGNYTVKTSFVPVTASLLLYTPLSDHFSPYGILGVGSYFTNFNFSEEAENLGFEDDSNFNFGYHLGFGMELPLSPNLALNLDYRYLFLNPDQNEESLDGADFSGNAFTAGLMFYL